MYSLLVQTIRNPHHILIISAMMSISLTLDDEESVSTLDTCTNTQHRCFSSELNGVP